MRSILDPSSIPKFVGEKQVIAVIHQLACEFWFYETKFPLNYIGYDYLEKKRLSNYENTITLALSDSTKIDLERLSFKRVIVVPPGLNVTPLSNVKEKEANPTVVFMGRLKKQNFFIMHYRLFQLSSVKYTMQKCG